jgi:hypothetical protein
MDLTLPESLENVISHIDYTMQYGEDEEPKEVRPCPISQHRILMTVYI